MKIDGLPHLFDAVLVAAMQGTIYDPDGLYIRKWVPELAEVPTAHIHQPWRMSRAQQEDHGVRLPEDYPLPISGTQYGEAE
jgi:deoxyribodipyrimidine photolyase